MGSFAAGRNPLAPRKGKRKVRKVIHVVTEGESERDYLAMDAIRSAIQDGGSISLKQVKPHPGQNDPASLVRCMKRHLKRQDFRKNDEAWIVVDVDQWTEKQFDAAALWENEDPRHHLAISNPKFELFLLLHFEDGRGCMSASVVDARLKRHWIDYGKRIPSGKFTLEEVREAIKRAECVASHGTDCMDGLAWTTVHRLISELIDGAA